MRIKTLIITGMAVALGCFTGLPEAVAGFELGWSTIDGGGGVSASADGRFSLHGTAGQPDAGLAQDSRFALESGYWNSIRCAYGLTIARFHDPGAAPGVDSILVSWPVSDQCECVLEATTELHSDPRLNVWTPMAHGRAGGVNVYSVLATDPARFFRLRQ